MKYLGKDPFSSKPSTDSYRKGWDEVFGRCREINDEMEAAQAKYRRTNPIMVAYDKAMAAERKKRRRNR